MSDDLFTPRSRVMLDIAKWDETKHPRDDHGRWTEVIAREVGHAVATAGVTALITAIPGLFSVARTARSAGALGRGSRREAFLQPYRDLVNRVRSVRG